MTQDNRDYEALLRQIENLNIEVSKNADGLLTVCSTSEPLFCYDAQTPEEAVELVKRTLRSYAKHFFHVDAGVTTECAPIAEAPLPIERTTPISRIKPVFDLAA